MDSRGSESGSTDDEDETDSRMMSDPLEGLEHIRPRQYRTNSAHSIMSIRAPPSALMQVKQLMTFIAFM